MVQKPNENMVPMVLWSKNQKKIWFLWFYGLKTKRKYGFYGSMV